MTRGEGTFAADSVNNEEIILRVILKNKPVSPRVTLAIKDLDWFCDCGDRNDPCSHVAAAVIATKRGDLQAPAARNATPTPTFGNKISPAALAAALPTSKFVEYRFCRSPQGPTFERVLVTGNQESPITGSLLSAVTGSQSGRLPGPRMSATKADFSADYVLKARGRSSGLLDKDTLHNLLSCLEDCPTVTLDGKPVKTSKRPAGMRTRLVDEGRGFRLQRYQNTEGLEHLGHGVMLDHGVMRPLEASKLSEQEDKLLAGDGQFYPPERAAELVTDILPALQKKTPIDIRTQRLPRIVEIPPRVVLHLEKEDNDTLSIVAKLMYGDPPLAQVNTDNNQLIRLGRDTPERMADVVLRDPNAERQALQKLRIDLNLQPGRRVQFHGQAAVKWVKALKGWDLMGNGHAAFMPTARIEPRIDIRGNTEFNVSFDALGPALDGKQSPLAGRVDPARMFRAWRDGAEFVPLIDGGWAPLPVDWLRRYGKRLSDLLAAKDAHDKIPAHLAPELADLCDDMGQSYPDALTQLKQGLTNFEGIPDYPLPKDLTAQLRAYQKKGVNWLSFLRESKLGALLADDMGLGKTLQTLCAIQGRTLVVAPTSVLQNWAAEIQKFRPGLKSSVYYGPQRTLDSTADVILTTYALLRMDLEKLSAQEWDTLVLDEAQTIKNPDSQVARAAHQLPGTFRIALSGTPIENRLDDLWSQFRFLNPGFLGTRESFREEYINPISRGDEVTSARLRRRIKPFILRRLKRTVAPELPPRTETVLRCELSTNERELYDSLLIATRKEVMEQLEAGGSIMAALEVLLRLRQACCHPALLPGQREASESAKVQILMETLEESLEQGHRSLIFSQWTSFLDLIAAALKTRNIRYSRIDGSTQNRQDLVNEYQSPDGPPIMLISLKAGGTGLTLTAADHVFIMDPWWNPAVEDQAADRAHRIGQQNPVLIHRIVAQDTVEEKILLLQKKKMELAAAVLDGSGAAVSLTRNDLLDLLRD
ncbi:MAG: DEAD/DEAH box helicase [Bdellovibrionales bacterium]|nr:DEAD/DEAH box helicase [Bdellovibrionales bacterium]